MRDDLRDARAAIDWAAAQTPVLVERIERWKTSAYSVRIDTATDASKKIYRICNINPLDPLINAEAGVILNSLRSSLDLLVCALAARNGWPNCNHSYFPIWKSESDFMKPNSDAAKKIKLLSPTDQGIIRDQRPYPTGHLWALHELDIIRKHRRLLDAFVFPRGIGFVGAPPYADTFVSSPQCRFEEGGEVGWTDASAANGEARVNVIVAFDETGPMHGYEVAGTLSKFITLVRGIVGLFD